MTLLRTDVEALRIVAAFGIVWFHSGIAFGRDIAYAGLVVFLILTAYFAASSSRSYSLPDRASRLLLPCVIWSGFYAAVKWASGKPMVPDDYSNVSLLLATPAIHLWYLPFAFICVVMIDWLKRYQSVALTFAALVIAVGLLASSGYWREWLLIPPFAQYLHALPAVLLGVAFSGFAALKANQRSVFWFLLVAALVFTASLSIEGVSTTYCMGAAAALLLLRERSLLPTASWVNKLSAMTMGIYLLHPLALSALGLIGLSPFWRPLLAFIGALIVTYILRVFLPHRFTRYFI